MVAESKETATDPIAGFPQGIVEIGSIFDPHQLHGDLLRRVEHGHDISRETRARPQAATPRIRPFKQSGEAPPSQRSRPARDESSNRPHAEL